jgi:uncharacterized protein YpmS
MKEVKKRSKGKIILILIAIIAVLFLLFFVWYSLIGATDSEHLRFHEEWERNFQTLNGDISRIEILMDSYPAELSVEEYRTFAQTYQVEAELFKEHLSDFKNYVTEFEDLPEMQLREPDKQIEWADENIALTEDNVQKIKENLNRLDRGETLELQKVWLKTWTPLLKMSD